MQPYFANGSVTLQGLQVNKGGIRHRRCRNLLSSLDLCGMCIQKRFPLGGLRNVSHPLPHPLSSFSHRFKGGKKRGKKKEKKSPLLFYQPCIFLGRDLLLFTLSRNRANTYKVQVTCNCDFGKKKIREIRKTKQNNNKRKLEGK